MREFFRSTKPICQLLTLFFCFVLFFIVDVGFQVFFGNNPSIVGQLIEQMISQLLTFLLPACICAYLFSDFPSRYLCLSFGKMHWIMLVAAFFILLLILPFTDWTTQLNDQWHWHGVWQQVEDLLRSLGEQSQQLIQQFLEAPGVGMLLLNIFVLALVPAVCEEFFFRGGLQNILIRWVKNPHVAIAITAAIFSLMHLDMFAFLPRFVLGLLLGYLYFYGGSIWINAATHFLNNLLVVILSYLYFNTIISSNVADQINAPWFVILFGCVLALLLFYYVFIHPRSSNIKR